jgi:hypothetical protein
MFGWAEIFVDLEISLRPELVAAMLLEDVPSAGRDRDVSSAKISNLGDIDHVFPLIVGGPNLLRSGSAQIQVGQ